MKTEIHNAVLLTTHHFDAAFISKAIRDHNLWSDDRRIVSYSFNKFSKNNINNLNSDDVILLFADDPHVDDINVALHSNTLSDRDIIFL
jgi:hypothetical protein